MTRVLDQVNSPADVRGLGYSDLSALADEIRQVLIATVSETGGHLASSLGVVELTIGLHRAFNSPEDKIIWDVGHQAYAHKLLTGRKDQFGTLRQYGGLSGFPARSESPHDAFGGGHAGNSISAGLGMALARDLKGERYHVVAVIGDGSMGTGMALEAVNHAGHAGTRLIVVLNDNGMSISPSVGALSRLLKTVQLHPRYEQAKTAARRVLGLRLGQWAWRQSKRLKSQFEVVVQPAAVFYEQLGFHYLGPVDGHNMREIDAAFARARNEEGPTLVHVITQKGKGHAAAEANASKFHGLPPNIKATSLAPSYSRVFGDTVMRLMQSNDRVVAISAAMLDGTGLAPVAAAFPKRVFDVGICEQHAVTLAAGFATQGLVPIVAIYSTFLQRAYDQIVHDVCLQALPVVFAVDRAGIVGDDGKTHQGAFDITYLRGVPNMVLAAPKDEDEFQHMLYSAVNSGQTVAVRYPRGNGAGGGSPQEFEQVPFGKGELLRPGTDMAILALGSTVYPSLAAASMLEAEGVQCAVANARFAKPIDGDLVRELASTERLITVEEGAAAGGFGSAVLEALAGNSRHVKVECIGLPDVFVEHGTQEVLRSMYDLDARGIVKRAKVAFPALFSAPTRGRR